MKKERKLRLHRAFTAACDAGVSIDELLLINAEWTLQRHFCGKDADGTAFVIHGIWEGYHRDRYHAPKPYSLQSLCKRISSFEYPIHIVHILLPEYLNIHEQREQEEVGIPCYILGRSEEDCRHIIDPMMARAIEQMNIKAAVEADRLSLLSPCLKGEWFVNMDDTSVSSIDDDDDDDVMSSKTRNKLVSSLKLSLSYEKSDVGGIWGYIKFDDGMQVWMKVGGDASEGEGIDFDTKGDHCDVMFGKSSTLLRPKVEFNSVDFNDDVVIQSFNDIEAMAKTSEAIPFSWRGRDANDHMLLGYQGGTITLGSDGLHVTVSFMGGSAAFPTPVTIHGFKVNDVALPAVRAADYSGLNQANAVWEHGARLAFDKGIGISK